MKETKMLLLTQGLRKWQVNYSILQTKIREDAELT